MSEDDQFSSRDSATLRGQLLIVTKEVSDCSFMSIIYIIVIHFSWQSWHVAQMMCIYIRVLPKAIQCGAAPPYLLWCGNFKLEKPQFYFDLSATSTLAWKSWGNPYILCVVLPRTVHIYMFSVLDHAYSNCYSIVWPVLNSQASKMQRWMQGRIQRGFGGFGRTPLGTKTTHCMCLSGLVKQWFLASRTPLWRKY